MAKLSAYQKLKAENKELKKQLSVLATRPNSVEGLLIKVEWVMLNKLEEAVWMGENRMPQVFEGIMKQIENASS